MTAIDLLGPTGTLGGVTTRPTEYRSFGASDTFFQDCSSPDLDDGTEFGAAWFNQAMAVLRSVIRGNGQTAASADVVTQDNTDDLVLLKAIQHLIQRGQPKYCEDTSSTAGVITAALSPAPPELKTGMEVSIKANNTSGAGTVINLNGLGNVTVVRPTGAALNDADIWIGSINTYKYDGTHWQLTGADGPPVIHRNLDYYVGGTGASDANDGTAASVGSGHGPFATLQAAANAVAGVNLNGFSVNIHVANGSYAPVLLPNTAGSGSVNFIGNPSSPSSCAVVATANGISAIQGNNCGSAYSFNGFMVSASGSGQASGVTSAGAGSFITLQNIYCGNCTFAQIFPSTGTIALIGPITIVGGGGAFVYSYGQGGLLNISTTAPPSLNILNAVSYSQAFAVVTTLAQAVMFFSVIGGAGNVTGSKFQVGQNGVLNTNGSGINYLPGSSAGTQSGGGEYF